MAAAVRLELRFWSRAHQRLGQRRNQAAAVAQLSHIQEKASGGEEATEKRAWLPASLRLSTGTEPARLSREAARWHLAKGPKCHRIVEFIVLEGTFVLDLIHTQ